jgi:hypothetical protein
MGRLARWVCVGVVAAGCAETGDALFRKLPDAASEEPAVSPDGGLPESDAGPDAAEDDDVDAGEADAGEPDALDLDAML